MVRRQSFGVFCRYDVIFGHKALPEPLCSQRQPSPCRPRLGGRMRVVVERTANRAGCDAANLPAGAPLSGQAFLSGPTMSVFGSIMSAIFGAPAADAAPPAGTADVPVASVPAPATQPPVAEAPAAKVPAAEAGQAPAQTGQSVDVAAVLTAKAAQAGEALNWRSSIVDLMKLLGLDSSLAARKELAGELHYDGDTGDSAAMNVWLHKAVMQKLAENGGQVPADLKG